MADDRGVTCSQCGASTPLPDDLTVPTFQCAYCRATMETARFAGQASVSAAAVGGFLGSIVSDPSKARAAMAEGTVPRFQEESTATRPAACTACGAAVQVPLDVTVNQFSCAGCGHLHQVAAYVSDQERFELDQARQIAGNEALKRLGETGVACTKCGGRNSVPTDGTVQVECRFCGSVILLADHVGAGAVARAQLRSAYFEMQDERRAQEEAERYKARILFVVLVVVAGIAIAVTTFLQGH